MEVNDVRTMGKAAAVIARHGVKHVLVKGGHLGGDAVDVLWTTARRSHFQANDSTRNTLTAQAVFFLPRSQHALPAATTSQRK